MTIKPVRKAKAGDLCVMLLPDEADAGRLRQQQIEFRRYFSGHTITPVHLTCERFNLPDEAALPAIVEQLAALAQTTHPFPIEAVSLFTLPARHPSERAVLKWQAPVDNSLAQLVTAVEEILDNSDANRYYDVFGDQRGVTFLTKIEELDVTPILATLTLPQLLFQANELLLSRIIKHPGQYETVARFPLGAPAAII